MIPMKVTMIPIIVPKKKIDGIGNQWKNRDHPGHSIVEIGWNTQNSLGSLRKFAVIIIGIIIE